MTPTLQQAIKLLQMTRLELQDVVNQELVSNPVLEEQDPESPGTPDEDSGAAETRERELAEQAERSYRQLVADWQAKTPKPKVGVAAANGTRLSRPSAGQAARQRSVPEPALRSGVDHTRIEA